MIYITINTKGGTGKSTFAGQMLSAFLYIKNNNSKITLLEIDDENEDSSTFGKSDILKSKIIATGSIHMIDEIFFQEEDIIIDVGGNKTATIFLKQMKHVGEYKNIIWFIPLSAGEQDNLNALETYQEIKQLDPSAKIVFVLSNTHTNDIKWEFLYFFGNPYLETSLAVMKQLKNVTYLIIPFSPIINYSRTFGKTILDVSNHKTDFRAKAKAEKESDKRKKFIFYNRVKNEAIAYMDHLKEEVFPFIETYATETIKKDRNERT